MKIFPKLLIGFLTISLFAVFEGFISLKATNQIERLFLNVRGDSRKVIDDASEIASHAKRAEGSMMLFLAFNDEVAKDKYFKRTTSLLDHLFSLDKLLIEANDRESYDLIKEHAQKIESLGDSLIYKYTVEMAVQGRFNLQQNEELIRKFHKAAAGARRQAVKLVHKETSILNRQEAITSSIDIASYAKRAEGSMMLFLMFNDEVARDKIFKRTASISKLIPILKNRLSDPESKTILEKIQTHFQLLKRLTDILINNYSNEMAKNGSFNLRENEELIREFHKAAAETRRAAVQLGKISSALELAPIHKAQKTVASIRSRIYIVTLATIILSVLLGYFIAKSFSTPLRGLMSAIAEFGKGNLKEKYITTRKDEIGDLAISFNNMADQLLQNEQIRGRFMDQLEQKNIELERFAYTVSHDLKSPLVTVKGFLGLLEKDVAAGDAERIKKDIQHIKSATDNMASLLDDLLELSRIGQTANKPEQLSLNRLTEEVIFLLQGQIKESGAEIEVAPDMPSVLADKHRIGEVIQNLLENAIKFAGEGNTPKISVSAELQGNRVLCRVQDNGIGIEPRYQDQVFGLFDRLETSVEGTGVGLALAKRIIEVHNGEIWLESDGDGKGCVFCFTLPVPEGNIH